MPHSTATSLLTRQQCKSNAVATVQMAVAKAGIVTLVQLPLMFEAPTSVCMSFAKSKGWEPASRVVWEHLPTTSVCLLPGPELHDPCLRLAPINHFGILPDGDGGDTGGGSHRVFPSEHLRTVPEAPDSNKRQRHHHFLKRVHNVRLIHSTWKNLLSDKLYISSPQPHPHPKAKRVQCLTTLPPPPHPSARLMMYKLNSSLRPAPPHVLVDGGRATRERARNRRDRRLDSFHADLDGRAHRSHAL
jgi:hypothetical protein